MTCECLNSANLIIDNNHTCHVNSDSFFVSSKQDLTSSAESIATVLPITHKLVCKVCAAGLLSKAQLESSSVSPAFRTRVTHSGHCTRELKAFGNVPMMTKLNAATSEAIAASRIASSNIFLLQP